MNSPRVTLDQWRALLAVVDEGGFARAATALHRSQSSVSHAVQRLQTQLGVTLLAVHGRKAELTAAGTAVVERARALIRAAGELEALARHVDEGWEAEVRLVVDAAFPSALLMQALRDFLPLSRGTRVQLIEEVLSGVKEALIAGEADLAVAAQVPAGRLGEPLLAVEFVA
ncbi:MAG TPA: LysR family transcriptional regulator, partial [Thioalkalivibrio sp.]|nr:LysR family transcriptional regulator [Thioalkalivibrio sp.]